MIFRRKYSRFRISPRYCKTLDKLIAGSAQARALHEEGQIVTAEKIYNRKLCYHYGLCRGLLKKLVIEVEETPAEGIAELEKIRAAFLDFYALATLFNKDLTHQKEDAIPVIEQAIEIFRNKQ